MLAFVGLAVILGVEFVVRDLWLPMPPQDGSIVTAAVVEWLLFLGLIGLWLPRVEKRPLSSVGFRGFRFRHLTLGALAYLVYLVLSAGSSFLIEAAGLDSIRSLTPEIGSLQPATLVVLFLTGTVVEEVFYRGYLIERMTLLTRKRWLAGSLSWLLFSLVHLRFFGVGPTLDVSVLSAVLVILYLKEDNVWPCIVMHGMNGAFAYLLFPFLFG
jgi:membrane protease YdiL (CAAX protease family)